MRAAVATVPGSFIERKTASLAWHYRLADDATIDTALWRLRDRLSTLCERHGLSVVEESCVVELRTRDAHKGVVVEDVLQRAEPSPFVLAVGDDRTDEDMFTALPRGSMSVYAGVGESRARYRVHGPREVREMLERLCALPSDPWVLVVEDNEHMRGAVMQILANEGIEARAVADGEDALDQLRAASSRPALVLTDLMMPRVDGIELIATMRSDGELAHVPIVVMTATPFVFGMQRGIRVLHKPFSVDELVAAVREKLAMPR
jgi:CheY-like chemotaxis protein